MHSCVRQYPAYSDSNFDRFSALYWLRVCRLHAALELSRRLDAERCAALAPTDPNTAEARAALARAAPNSNARYRPPIPSKRIPNTALHFAKLPPHTFVPSNTTSAPSAATKSDGKSQPHKRSPPLSAASASASGSVPALDAAARNGMYPFIPPAPAAATGAGASASKLFAQLQPGTLPWPWFGTEPVPLQLKVWSPPYALPATPHRSAAPAHAQWVVQYSVSDVSLSYPSADMDVLSGVAPTTLAQAEAALTAAVSGAPEPLPPPTEAAPYRLAQWLASSQRNQPPVPRLQIWYLCAPHAPVLVRSLFGAAVLCVSFPCGLLATHPTSDNRVDIYRFGTALATDGRCCAESLSVVSCTRCAALLWRWCQVPSHAFTCLGINRFAVLISCRFHLTLHLKTCSLWWVWRRVKWQCMTQ